MNKYIYYIRPYLREPKKKAYTMVGMTIVALSVFGAFAIRPALSTVVSLRKEVQDLRRFDNMLEEKISAISIAQKNYKEVKKNLYLVDKALPNKPQEGRLLEDLNLLAARSGIAIRNITFSDSKNPKGTLGEINSKVVIYGNFKDLIEFLNLLENNLFQINPTSVSLNVRSRTRSNQTLGATVHLKTFYYEKEENNE